jgi:predicted RecA/RadA family phage recombinase
MRNFVQPGNVLTFPAPTGGCRSGEGVLVNAAFGVAAYNAAEGSEVECAVVGVYDLPKAAGAVAFGAKLYWSAANKHVTTTASGNTLIGLAAASAAANAATVAVRLNGTA